MSGIVAIINLDGAPVDRALLRRMTKTMTFRGPDAQHIWVDGYVGFGHTMLRTTPEALSEQQPSTLDGRIWITADARVDGRSDLIGQLTSRGCSAARDASDACLILHAYGAWHDACVDHLIGDFAFAIWDGPQQRLFCARDQLGVKPFYYAQVANCLIISNTLNCVRAHPAVSAALNDQAIGDFLLFDFNQDTATTSFADIQRLPAAHTLTWSGDAPCLRRYWSLPIDEPLRYRHSSDYVERFKELLSTAVEDRLRSDRVGVLMSGGLDSTAVAASAYDRLSQRSGSFELRAHTAVYDQLIPDEERHYARMAAEALHLAIHYLVVDDYQLYEGWHHPKLHKPEPFHDPLAAIVVDLFQQAVEHSRVVLSGQGGDPLLFPSLSYVWTLCKRLRFDRLFLDLGHYAWRHGRLPRVGLRTRLRHWLGNLPGELLYPPWLNQTFARRMALPARWEQQHRRSAALHPLHPETYAILMKPFWPYTFESYDPSTIGLPVEVRHPFFDLRLVRYLLAIPPMPWCVDKELLRVALCGVLPEPVRRRPKSPLAGDPMLVLVRHGDTQWAQGLGGVAEFDRYIDRDAVPQVYSSMNSDQLWVTLRPYTFNYWLKHILSDASRPAQHAHSPHNWREVATTD